MANSTLDEPQVNYSYTWASQVYDILGQSSIVLSDLTATAAELNIMDGVTASTADLNATTNFEETIAATTSEVSIKTGKTINIVDNSGLKIANTAVTSTAAELNLLDGLTGNVVTSPNTTSKIESGEYTMDATDDTNGFAAIATSLSAIAAAIVQIVDSGNQVVTSDADITWSGATLTVADGSSFTCTDTYKVRWIAHGT